MSVLIPVKKGIEVKIRSTVNGAYEQRFVVKRILQKNSPYQTIIPLGSYNGGQSFTLEAQLEDHEIEIQCQFFHYNLQNSKEIFRATNKETLWTIFADDSNDDLDYNDLIVQIDLGNNFENISGLISVAKP